MIIDVSAQELYDHLKNTAITRIFFTVEIADTTPSDDTSVPSSITNPAVRLSVNASTADENNYKAIIDFTGFDDVKNQIMAKSVPLLLALNQNTRLENLTFTIDKAKCTKKSHDFFNIFCTEMLMRVQTTNKQNLSVLGILGANQDCILGKQAITTPVIKFIEKTPGLKILSLAELSLTDDDSTPIVTFLCQNKIRLTELELVNNHLSDVGIKQVLNYLREVRSLVSLDLSSQASAERFILDMSFFKSLLSTLTVLPHRMDYLGLADLYIDDCAFEPLYYKPGIVVNKIQHLDVSDNELSYKMIDEAEKAFKALDSNFDFQCDECCAENIVHCFMWNDEEIIPDLFNECTTSELSDIDSNENTPAHYLAQHGNLDGLKQLKTLGALLKEKNQYGFTPLHTAIRYSQIDVVNWFMHAVKSNDLEHALFVVALAASDNIAMFNLLRTQLKKRFTKFLNLTYNEHAFCHLLANQSAVTLLSYAIEEKLISKTLLEAYCRSEEYDKKPFSPFMLGLMTAKIHKTRTVEFFKFMISQKVEVRRDDIDNINAYVQKVSDKRSLLQETLYEQTAVYQNLKAIFDAVWRDYAIVYDSEQLSFTLTLSQADLQERFKSRREFANIVGVVLKHLFKVDVDHAPLCVFGEKNTVTLMVIKSSLKEKIDIEELKHDLFALVQKYQKAKPRPSEKPKQKNTEGRPPKPKRELAPPVRTPAPIDAPTTEPDTAGPLLVPETTIYQSKDLFKKNPQKKVPTLSKQNPSHGEGKNAKNLKRREKYLKKIEKETAKEQLKIQREHHRLQKEAEREAKAQQKAEENRLIKEPQLAEAGRLAVSACEAKLPQLTAATQGFFYQREPRDDDSDEEGLFKLLDEELMKLKMQLTVEANGFGFQTK